MPLYGYFKVPLTVPHLAVEDDQWTEHTVLGWVLGVVEMVLPILTVLTTFMCFFFSFYFSSSNLMKEPVCLGMCEHMLCR